MNEEATYGLGIIEGVLGAGALALGIIGLAGAHPAFLAAIATILVAAMFMLEGTAVVRRLRALVPASEAPASGLTVQTGAGAAGLVLGILAILQVASVILVGAAVIVFGAAFVLSASAGTQGSEAGAAAPGGNPEARQAARQLAGATAGGGVLLGAGNIVLGILAVVMVGSAATGHAATGLTLVLIALLATGGAALLSGTAGQRLFSAMGL